MPQIASNSSASQSAHATRHHNYETTGHTKRAPQLFSEYQTLAADERQIENEYQTFREGMETGDRRVSYADFELSTEHHGDLDEDTFHHVCQTDPQHIYELTGKIMNLTRRARTENAILHKANKANVNHINHLFNQIQELEAEPADTHNEIERLNAMVDKKATQVNQFMKHLNDAERKHSQEVGELHEKVDKLQQLLADTSTTRGRRSHALSLSPASRDLANRATHPTSKPSHLPLCQRSEDLQSTSGWTNPSLDSPMDTNRGVPTPKIFSSADDSYDVYQFIQTLEIKLGVTTFRTNVDGLRYVLSLLTGPAYKLAAPRIPSSLNGRQCYNPFDDIEHLTKELLERFGDVNTENKAWSAIMAIKQHPNETFSSFYNKFTEFRSQIPDMRDAQELQLLQTKLNETYHAKVLDGSTYTKVKDFVARVRNLDQQLKEHKKLFEHAADSRVEAPSRPSSFTGSKAPGQLRAHEDIPEKYQNLTPLTPEARERLMQRGACLRCREDGHHQHEPVCPLRYQPQTNNDQGKGMTTV